MNFWKIPGYLQLSLLIIIILGITFAIAIGRGFAYRAPSITNQQEPQAPSSFPENNFDKANLTSEWGIYNDEDMNFSIKYPNNWSYEVNPYFQQPRMVFDALETRVVIAEFPPPYFENPSVMPEGCYFGILAASTQKNPKQLLEEYKYKQIAPRLSLLEETNMVINGIEGIKKTYLAERNTQKQMRTALMLPGDSHLFVLYYGNMNKGLDTSCDETFESMIHTFSIQK